MMPHEMTSLWMVARQLARASQPPGLGSLAALAHARIWRAAVGEAFSLRNLEDNGCRSDGSGPRRKRCDSVGDVLDSREFTPSGRVVCNGRCRDIGDVLDVPASLREALRAFVEEFPEELEPVVEALKFRQMVSDAVMALRAQERAA